jgi:hypothetical protein
MRETDETTRLKSAKALGLTVCTCVDFIIARDGKIAALMFALTRRPRSFAKRKKIQLTNGHSVQRAGHPSED